MRRCPGLEKPPLLSFPLNIIVIACDKREAFAQGSETTKQSRNPHYGLLRGVYHRARIRATRWLAMTCLTACSFTSSRAQRILGIAGNPLVTFGQGDQLVAA